MRLVDQWRQIEADLPESWEDARLGLAVSDQHAAGRALSLLAPANPSGRGGEIRFFCARRGAGTSPERVQRLLARLDAERMDGRLELLEATAPNEAPTAGRATLAAAWDAVLTTLPPDWSDVYAEVQTTSTDYLDRAALLLSPVNPARFDDRPAFRFRCARRFGYGASAGMVRRCFERLDDNGIPGEIRILRALSDSRPVSTQGPVWYVRGKPV